MTYYPHHTKQAFTLAEPPTWRCPTCGGGPLRFDQSEFRALETAATKAVSREEWFEADVHARLRFAGFAHCPNPECHECVLIAGAAALVSLPDPAQEEETFIPRLAPTIVSPAPVVIDVLPVYPDNVSAAITRAFELHWADASAAANAIRVAVEALLDHLRVKRLGKDRRPIALHSRIHDIFRKRDSVAADHLLAIKWIGNAGSHEGRAPTDADVLDAFEILDHVLHDLLVRRPQAKRVASLSRRINRAKGPRRAQRKSGGRKRRR